MLTNSSIARAKTGDVLQALSLLPGVTDEQMISFVELVCNSNPDVHFIINQYKSKQAAQPRGLSPEEQQDISSLKSENLALKQELAKIKADNETYAKKGRSPADDAYIQEIVLFNEKLREKLVILEQGSISEAYHNRVVKGHLENSLNLQRQLDRATGKISVFESKDETVSKVDYDALMKELEISNSHKTRYYDALNDRQAVHKDVAKELIKLRNELEVHQFFEIKSRVYGTAMELSNLPIWS